MFSKQTIEQTSKKLKRFFSLLFLLILNLSSVKAQNYFATHLGIDFNIPFKNKYGLDAGIAHRNFLYENASKKADYLELIFLPYYKLNSKNKVSTGVKFKNKQLFEKEFKDELRFIQQFDQTFKKEKFNIKTRFRIEERIRNQFSFRNRYKVGFYFPVLNSKEEKIWELHTETEALWNIPLKGKTSFDQRFSFGISKMLSENYDLFFQIQYRNIDYTNHPKDYLLMNVHLKVSL